MVEVHKPGGMFRYAAPPPQSARSALANVLVDPSKLPDRPITIPGAKPPVSARPYKDRGRPEEVDEFRQLIREIRRQVSLRPK